MEKKSVSATFLVIFVAIFCSIIGICFSSFVYPKTKIEVKKVTLSASSSVSIFSDKNLTKSASELKLSSMELGLKPATGELDSESQIPSTITDEGTSEGYYSTIYVKTTSNFKIILKDIKIETKKNEIEANEQRKNIFIAIKDIKNSTKDLKEEEIEIASFENVSETLSLTIFIWLGSLAEDALEGAKINFTLEFREV